MALAEKALITADEFRQLPEGPPFYQLIDGELFMSPSPESFHQRIILNLAVTLENYLEKKPIGEVYIAPLDVYFTEFNVFEPDLIFISKARLHLVDRRIEGAPDLVAEVLSPSTARLDARKTQDLRRGWSYRDVGPRPESPHDLCVRFAKQRRSTQERFQRRGTRCLSPTSRAKNPRCKNFWTPRGCTITLHPITRTSSNCRTRRSFFPSRRVSPSRYLWLSSKRILNGHASSLIRRAALPHGMPR